MRFTDSPYELMMKQKPAGQRAAVNPPPVFPPDHPCHGCPYSRNGPCLGICYRKLMEGRKKKSGHDSVR